MGWLTKILKGSSSSHKISEGRYHERYEDEEIWEEPPTIVNSLSDFDDEEIDRAIALSLMEEDERSVCSLVEDDKKSACSGVEEEEEGSVSSVEGDQKGAVSSPDEHNRGSNSTSEEDHKGKKVIDDDFYLEEDEQLAKAIQESLNVDSPPRNKHGSLFPPLPNFFPSVYRICAGCNCEIGQGRFLNCIGGVWHPECFRCHACNIPITDYEVQLYSKSNLSLTALLQGVPIFLLRP